MVNCLHCMRKILIFLLLGAALLGMSRAPAEPPIGVTTFEMRDESRERPVTVEFWYPTTPWTPGHRKESVWVHPVESRNAPYFAQDKPRPLILLSHGHAGDRRDRSWLAESLVKQGYLVASVEHHGNTWRTMDPVASLKFWERPRDVSFALDAILADPVWGERIDRERIGFVGYSLGGMTGLALAGGEVHHLEQIVAAQRGKVKEVDVAAEVNLDEAKVSFYDPRIKAIVLIAPATWGYDPQEILAQGTPIGIIAPEEDDVLPPNEHLNRMIEGNLPIRLKVLAPPVAHNSFVNRISEWGKVKLPSYYLREGPGFDREKLHKETAEFVLNFFGEFLDNSVEERD